jgi:hypothetical protein
MEWLDADLFVHLEWLLPAWTTFFGATPLRVGVFPVSAAHKHQSRASEDATGSPQSSEIGDGWQQRTRRKWIKGPYLCNIRANVFVQYQNAHIRTTTRPPQEQEAAASDPIRTAIRGREQRSGGPSLVVA